VEDLSLYEIIGAIAFLILIAAHPLAVFVLQREWARSDQAHSPAATSSLSPYATERFEDACRTLRSRFLRDLLRPAR
jgi:hypothetical protein